MSKSSQHPLSASPYLLCTGDTQKWRLDQKQEFLNTLPMHNTGLKQTPVWNLKAGQKISQQPPTVRCERIILIFSVNTATEPAIYPYSLSHS